MPVLIKRILQRILGHPVVYAAHVEGRDGLVGRGREVLLALVRLGEHPVGHRVVDAVVPVLDVLLSELGRGRELRHVRVAVARAVGAVRAVARVAQPERADGRLVLVVVGLLSRHLLEQLGGANLADGSILVSDGHLVALLQAPGDLLRLVLEVDVGLGDHLAFLAEDRVSRLHRDAVVEVEEAHLAHVLRERDLAAHHGFLVPGLVPGSPSEYGEGAGGDGALGGVVLALHANVRVGPEAVLAHDGKVGALPPVRFGVPNLGLRGERGRRSFSVGERGHDLARRRGGRDDGGGETRAGALGREMMRRGAVTHHGRREAWVVLARTTWRRAGE